MRHKSYTPQIKNHRSIYNKPMNDHRLKPRYLLNVASQHNDSVYSFDTKLRFLIKYGKKEKCDDCGRTPCLFYTCGTKCIKKFTGITHPKKINVKDETSEKTKKRKKDIPHIVEEIDKEFKQMCGLDYIPLCVSRTINFLIPKLENFTSKFESWEKEPIVYQTLLDRWNGQYNFNKAQLYKMDRL